MSAALSLLHEGEEYLSPLPDARHDALALLRRALNLPENSGVLDLLDAQADEEQAEAFRALLRARRAGRPLQYILREAWFMGLRFYVDERVLIPRQDTELLCELALKKGARTALDLCTGSGALCVALQKLGDMDVTATDINAGALSVARKNAADNGCRIEFLLGDLFAPLGADRRFDLIVCNPPYLTKGDMACLQTEVRHEPPLALFGGADGLEFYRRLRLGFCYHLNEGGSLLMEVGRGQAQAVTALFAPYQTRLHRDLNGIERVVEVCL